MAKQSKLMLVFRQLWKRLFRKRSRKTENIHVQRMEYNILEKEDSKYFSDDDELQPAEPENILLAWEEYPTEPHRRPSLDSNGFISLARIPEPKTKEKRDLSFKLEKLFGEPVIDQKAEQDIFYAFTTSAVEINVRNGAYTEQTIKRCKI